MGYENGKCNEPSKQAPSSGNTLANGTWKALKTNMTTIVSPKDIRDKNVNFKSPKYISINKNQTIFKANTVYNKCEEKPL